MIKIGSIVKRCRYGYEDMIYIVEKEAESLNLMHRNVIIKCALRELKPNLALGNTHCSVAVEYKQDLYQDEECYI